ncbi:ATP-binding protein [Mesorhizobium sp. M0027]|uniref:ATP-binding protein n=1 Tax=Mesorhizobium sp. M0027 TaxID=2956848 RepID=UPI00333D07F3
MLAHPTLGCLHAMGLAGMARAFDELAANAEAEQLSHAEWLGLLLDREWNSRYDRKLAALLRFAKLPHQAAPEDVDYRSERGLDRAMLVKLIGGTASTLMTTWPSAALQASAKAGRPARSVATPACRLDRSVLYQPAPRMFANLTLARGDGRYARLQRTLGRVQLLILDNDWGLETLDDQARHDLLEILEDRYGRRSTIITSQLPVSAIISESRGGFWPSRPMVGSLSRLSRGPARCPRFGRGVKFDRCDSPACRGLPFDGLLRSRLGHLAGLEAVVVGRFEHHRKTDGTTTAPR